MKTWRLLALFTALWLCAIIAGLYIMMNYELTPGAPAQAPSQWPPTSKIKLSAQCPTLVMLAHPKCPCTRASIAELAQLMTKHKSQVTAYVLFLSPKSMPPAWEKTDLWDSAAAIPGVTVVADSQADEVQRFQAQTSGQTLLYDANGRLLYSGGITGSRGHVGDNVGLQAVAAILDKAPAATEKRQQNLVFGCSLRNPLTSANNR